MPAEIFAEIKIDGKELSEIRFAPIKEAEKILNVKLAKRLAVCMEALNMKYPVYLENGQKVE